MTNKRATIGVLLTVGTAWFLLSLRLVIPAMIANTTMNGQTTPTL